MRRNSVRHFVHMVIDILPLLIIPIFALNILHKETEPISIEVQENKEVNFNQIEYKQLVNTTNNSGVDFTTFDTYVNVVGTATSNIQSVYFDRTNFANNTIGGHYYILRGCAPQGSDSTYYLEPLIGNQANFVKNQPRDYGMGVKFQLKGTDDSLSYMYGIRLVIKNGTQVNDNFRCQLFDLTLMGFEDISLTEFNQYFNEEYYEYNLGTRTLIPDYSVTYNDTDIGSQFVYALYKPVNDYFNFNNLFNMGAIYNWIELNLFSGTAPLPIFIIWNVIVYEFFVDLIFLLYAVFMFVIDFSTSMIDKFMYKSKRGI